ncbi:MAG: flagellar basal body rod protein FlgC [Planctomycetota bacterium]
MLSSLDISASGMSVLQAKMNVVSNNLANMETVTEGVPYRRRHLLVQPGNAQTGSSFGAMVKDIVEDTKTPMRPRYEPNHPYADEKGYVYYPNVNPMVEMTDAMTTIRGYQYNATAFDAAKIMAQSALRLLA